MIEQAAIVGGLMGALVGAVVAAIAVGVAAVILGPRRDEAVARQARRMLGPPSTPAPTPAPPQPAPTPAASRHSTSASGLDVLAGPCGPPTARRRRRG